MKAWAVIGANFGDEGKGLMTDYLVRKNNASVVYRYNGGAQAGHTVQLPDGKRHVFHHFGSGTFAGALTYLGPHFISNPYLFVEEQKQLKALDPLLVPQVMVHPSSYVTTPYDMLLNQLLEKQRGNGRHGSCGVGIFETVNRSWHSNLRLKVGDLHNGTSWLLEMLHRIRKEWVPERAAAMGLNEEDTKYAMREGFIDSFLDRVDQFRNSVAIESFKTFNVNGRNIVFEGAQGLALDQNHRQNFPFLTPSNTGSRNVIEACQMLGIRDVELVYVTRSYITRHGAGPMLNERPREEVSPNIMDLTNVPHDFQGTLRFAPMDSDNRHATLMRCDNDRREWEGSGIPMPVRHFAVTHLDQMEHPFPLSQGYVSHGPTHLDVQPYNMSEDHDEATSGRLGAIA